MVNCVKSDLMGFYECESILMLKDISISHVIILKWHGL